MSTWIPVGDPPPPDDFHTWARPASPPCPDCECCSAELCRLARERHTRCAHLGDFGPGVMDGSRCPCTQNRGDKT